jgi:DNA-binding MarR family transcriptional regulator
MKHYSTRSFDPARSIGFLVKRCASLLAVIRETALDSEPVTPAGFVALMSLRERSPLSPSELSTRTGYDMGGLTRVVDALERGGFVKRDRSRTDRRAVQIAITASGLAQAERSLTLIVGLLNHVLEPFSKREVESLTSLLQRLAARLQQSAGVQPPAHSARAPTRARSVSAVARSR